MPSGSRWLHEIKFDGYRVQVHLKDAAVKVFTRRGNDWTNRFKKIASDAWHVSAGSAIIDGEVVAPAEDGTTEDKSKSRCDGYQAMNWGRLARHNHSNRPDFRERHGPLLRRATSHVGVVATTHGFTFKRGFSSQPGAVSL